MRLWRISNYADLSGRGGLKTPARWHSKGRPIVYCADHPAGALLELLVQVSLENLPDRFQLLTIDIEDGIEPAVIDAAGLKEGWNSDTAYTRAIGDAWLAKMESLLLRVPSAIVPHAFNLLGNPRHGDAVRMRIVEAASVPLDQRLTHRQN